MNEKLQNVQWGEYRIRDLFDSENGDFDIQKSHINDVGEYVITAGLTNNGILGKTNISAKVINGGTITIDMFGNSFYRHFKYKMVTHARVFSLIPKFDMSKEQGLYIVNSFKYLIFEFGYENMCSWAKIQNIKIQLPIKNGKIDFEFMESFISELEEERISELEEERISELSAYLTVSGLDNYELSSEEKEALENLNTVQWEEKNVTDQNGIFNVKNTKNILSTDITPNSGTTPYLCASAENNSISTYIDYKEELKDKGNCIFIGGKTFVVSYQKVDFFSNDSHNLALYLKNENKADKTNQLFMATCVKKGLSHKYSWGNSISNKKIQKDKIMLPTKNNEIDFSYMELLISAVQKLVIKDVVLWKDKKIEATKQVVGRN
nr:restriction endonuclease subunit S [Histophilus somni]